MLTAAPDQVCFGVGYALQPITARLNMNYYFLNCKKSIILNMGDYKTSWVGKDAKWIDECVPPDISPIITMFNVEVAKGLSETAVIGGTTKNQQGCFKYGVWTTWAPYLLGYG